MNGYAKFPNTLVFSHDLMMMTSKHIPLLKRHKVFNYFNLKSDDYFITMAHFDAGAVRAAFFNVRNLKTAKVHEVKVDDYFSNKVHIDASKIGDEIYSHIWTDELKLRFFKMRNRNAKIDVNGGKFDGYFYANFEGQEGISTFTQYTEDAERFGIDFKAASILFDNGKLSYNGKLLFQCTKEKPCVGQLDQA